MSQEELIQRNRLALAGKQPGDIIFFHPVSFNLFGSLILAVTGQYYHHGAVVVDDTTLIEADYSKGVHTYEIEQYLSDYQLDLFRLKTEHNGANIVNCAIKYKDWLYDYGNVIWAGIWFIILRLTGINIFRQIKSPFDDEDKVESEEYISLVFKDYGIQLRPDIPSTNVTAQDLSDSPLLFKVNDIEPYSYGTKNKNELSKKIGSIFALFLLLATVLNSFTESVEKFT